MTTTLPMVGNSICMITQSSLTPEHDGEWFVWRGNGDTLNHQGGWDQSPHEIDYWPTRADAEAAIRAFAEREAVIAKCNSPEMRAALPLPGEQEQAAGTQLVTSNAVQSPDARMPAICSCKWDRTHGIDHTGCPVHSRHPPPAPAASTDVCTNCHRPFATVEDFRAITFYGKCPTRYAPRDPDAAKDCEVASQPAPAPAPAAEPSDPHPERYCGRCGGPNMIWSAASPLWNAVMRDADGSDKFGIICPTCFCLLAKEAGVADTFRLYSDAPLVQLAETDADGRRWNAETFLWEATVAAEPAGKVDRKDDAEREFEKYLANHCMLKNWSPSPKSIAKVASELFSPHSRCQRCESLAADLSHLRSQLDGLTGALADAGTVLAIREDGNYGESVRELTAERDRLRGEVAAARDEYKSLGFAAHDHTPAEMISLLGEFWGDDQTKLKAANAKLLDAEQQIKRLRSVVHTGAKDLAAAERELAELRVKLSSQVDAQLAFVRDFDAAIRAKCQHHGIDLPVIEGPIEQAIGQWLAELRGRVIEGDGKPLPEGVWVYTLTGNYFSIHTDEECSIPGARYLRVDQIFSAKGGEYE